MRNLELPRLLFSFTLALLGAACGDDDVGPSDASPPDGMTASDGGAPSCSGFALPGDSFYPEGIERSADGTLWVGSFTTGEIVTLAPGATTPSAFAPSGGSIVQAVGLRYQSDLSVLWVCSVDTMGAAGSQLIGLSTDDASQIVSHELPEGSFCNDIATDGAGNLYVTDSFGSRIFRLAAADRNIADSLEIWSDAAAFGEGAMPGDFTLNGIAVMGSDVFVVRSDDGTLLRVGIETDGSAAEPVRIDLGSDAVTNADGLTSESSGVLLVARNFVGRLDRVTLDGDTGSVTNVSSDLDVPATLVVDGDRALVTETQFDHLFMPEEAGPARTPFCVASVPL